MFWRKSVLFVVAVFASLYLSGCGGSSKPPSVAVTASATTVDGLNSVTLTATVTNDKNDDGVTWTVSGGGTLSKTTTTSATYTAPAVPASALTVTVTATSVADTAKTASVTLTVPGKLKITSTGGATGSLAGTVGTVYSVQLQTSGGVSPYKWTLAAGSTLPACLSMTSAGLITSTGPLMASCAVDPNITFDVSDSGDPPMTASLQLDLVINPAPPIVFSSTTIPPPTATYGTPYTGTVSASGGVGALTYSASGLPTWLTFNATTLTLSGTPSAVGKFTFAIQASDAYGDSTSQSYSVTVGAKTPTLTFAAIPTKAYGNPPFTVSATSASSGAVTYSVTSGPATINSTTGQVTLTGAGTVVLGASQAASGDYGPATASVSFTVNPGVPTLTFAPIPAKSYGDPPFTVSATSQSSGAVTYSVTSGPATINSTSGLVTLTGTGTVVLGASQAAAANYTVATASATFTVYAEAPTLVFAAIPTKTYGNPPFTVSATSQSSGAVTYSVTSGPATINSTTGLVTLTGAGKVVLGASQAASGNYGPATASITFTVNPATPTLTFAAIPAKTYGTPPFTVSATSASTGEVAYSVTSGPATINSTTGLVTLTGVGTVKLSASQAATTNYTAATATASFTVNPEPATVTLGSLQQTYTGSPLSATATTNPSGLAVTFTYNGSATPPTNAGSYTVVGTVSNADYTGSATGTLVISKATATVTLGSLAQTYTGSPLSATATTNPAGLTVTFTYNGSATPLTNAGSYTVVGTISNANYTGSATGTLVISKATATVTLGGLAQTYTGSPLSATATTVPTGLTVTFTYNGSATAPTNAGSYAVVGTISSANYAGSATGTLVISPASATVTLTPSSLAQTYTGSPISAAATTVPAGLAVSFTYNGSSTAPTAVGSYAVVASISNTNYTAAPASGTLVISQATATVTLGNLAQTYTGSPLSATATTAPSGLPVTFTYNGSSTPPTAPGSYTVVGTVNTTDYAGSATGTLVISKATATVTLGSLAQTYTGSPLSATATTNPAGLTVTFTYNGSSTPPTNAGSYTVVGTISSANYTGSATGTLVISGEPITLTFTSSPTYKTYGNAAFTVTASDSSGPVSSGAITYSVTSGPATINSTSGLVTLSNPGAAPGTVWLQASQAASGNYASATASTSFIVYPTLTLTASTLPTGVVGSPYNQSLVSLASGGDGSSNYSWATNSAGVTSLSTLGLTLNSNGTVTGTPSTGQTGAVSFPATVSDTAGNTATATMQVTINASLIIPAQTLPFAYTGTAYSYTVVVTGGMGGNTWSVTSNGTQLASLGLTLNSSTGILSGTASSLAAGSTTFGVQVKDSTGATATQTLTVYVYAPLALQTPSASVPGPAVYGTAYAGSINVSGGSGNFTWTVTGLPAAGFSYNTNGYTMSIGAETAPSTAQTISFTVKVTDNTTGKYTSTIQYSIVVGPQTPLTLLPASGTALPGAITGESYTNNSIYLSNGSNSGYAFSVGVNGGAVTSGTSWTLPDNLTASTSGNVLTISGKPNATTPITLVVSGTDSGNDTAGPSTYTLAVTNPAPLAFVPSAGALTAAVIGQSYSNAINVTGGDQLTYTWTVNGATVTGTPLPIDIGATSTPSGITVSNTGGNTLSINGPCTEYGTATLNVSVLDVGTGQSISPAVQYTIACNPPQPLALTPNPNPLPSGTVNNAYNAQVNASNGSNSGYVFSVTVGTTTTVVGAGLTVPLGDNIQVSSSGGTLNISSASGTPPTQAADIQFSVTLNDSAGDPSVTQSYVIAIINPAAGYTVSGTISYPGSKTGWVYIRLNNTNCNGGCGNSNLGTAINATTSGSLAAGMSFTINGVPPGTYQVYAFMDTIGYGAQNASDPTGASGATTTVTNLNVTGANDTLIDPGTPSITQSPTWDSSQGSGSFSTGAFVYFDSITSGNNNNNNNGGIEIPSSYTVEYSTSPTFATGSGILSGSQSFAATGGNSPWIVTGLTTGDTYYFRAAGVVGSGSSAVTGPYSAISPGIPIGVTPAGSVAVSVTVNFTGTATGPLYVGFYNSTTGQIYATTSGSKTNPPTTGHSYTVNVPTGSSYFLFGIIDQNNTGLISAPGEISNTNQNNMTSTVITSSTTSETVTLPTGNSVAAMTTRNSQQTGLNGVTTDYYGLEFQVNGLLKLPVSVELRQGTVKVPGVVVPTDIATAAFNGDSDEFKYSPNLNGDIPKQGDAYNLFITYSDSTTAVPDTQTVTVTVGAPLNAFATLISPTWNSTNVSTEPNFSWTYPAGASSSDTYSFQLSPSNGNAIWEIPAQHSSSNGFSSTMTPLIDWGVDPTGTGDLPSVPILNSDSTYWWQITTSDANGDEATAEVEFQTFGTPLSLPATNPSTLPLTTVLGVSYQGSVTVIGGVGPYNWQVNWTTGNDNLGWYTNGADNATLYINGNPSQTGTVTFQVTVYDSTGASYGPVTYNITVNPQVSGTYPVSGEINFNGCGGNEPPVTLTLSAAGFPSQTAVTDGQGNYQFPGVPNGTYTLTPSITGAASSAFVPATQQVVVNGSSVYNSGEFNAYLGYTVSGLVAYEGGDSGQIYLAMNGCGTPTPGTSLRAPGAFTIHGVPPGNYTLQAWMDNKSVVSGQQLGGYGVQNASNPTGQTPVLVTDANVTDVSVGLTNPSAVTLGSAPTWQGGQGSGAFSGGAFVSFNSITNNGIEVPTSYILEYSTDSTFATGVTSKSFAATGGNSPWIVTGLTNNDTYYFRARGVMGSGASAVTGPWSAASPAGGMLIGAPSGGNAVSGKVTFSAPTGGSITGPMYVGLWNQNTGKIYAEEITSPVSPQAYGPIGVPTGSNYFFFAFIDQNNDGMIDPGDITSTNVYNMITPAVAISGETTENLTLPSANSWIIMQTANNYSSLEWGASQGYGLGFIVSTQNKLPVAVELTSGSNILTPMDIALCQQCAGDPNARFTSESLALNGSIAPTVGNAYGVTVTYSDGTSEKLTPAITNVLPLYPGNLSPAGPDSDVNPKPTLTWNYPDTNAASTYTYQMWFADDNWNTVWSIPGIYSNANPFTTATVPGASITWGTDPTDPENTPTQSSLNNGEVYYWEIQAFDTNGNTADYLTDYVSGFTAVALPATNPSTLGSPVLGQNYNGSITATGGYGGYSYAVNGNNCYGCTGASLGDNLTVTNASGTLQITGVPDATGSVTFTVEAQDTTGTKSASVQYTINVVTAPLTLSGTSTVSAWQSQSFSQTITASGGSGSGYTFEVSVDGGVYSSVPLPLADGLSAAVSGNTLTISGTPGSLATVSLSIYVKDSQGNNTTQSDTIDVVSPPNGANNKYLSGTYVCKMDGFMDSDGSRWTSVSSFKANGVAGTITNGMWDTNGRDFSSEMSGTATGSYSIGSDNNGVMTMNSTVTSGGTGTYTGQYAIALNDTSPLATATEFRMVEIDDVGSNPSGMTGTGDCYQANTSVFGTDVFTGNSFVFSSNGEGGDGTPEAGVGRMVASGGSVTGGVLDQAKLTDTSVTEIAFTGGTYTTPDAANGRSTLTITASGGTPATSEVYVIDANRMFVIDTSDVKANSGDMRKQQQVTYSGTNLSGPFVLYTQGQQYAGSAWSYYSPIMQGTGNGVVSTGTGSFTINQDYDDSNGTYKVGNNTGGPIDVTFDATNPGRSTFSTGGSGQAYLYFFNTNSAFELDFNGSEGYLETGWMEPQSETTFTYAAVAGTYLFGGLPRMEPGSNGNAGEFILSSCTSGSASCGLTGGITTGGEGSFSYDQSLGSMTYNWDTTVTGTGSFLSGTGSKGLSCMVISATRDVCIFNGDDSPSVAILQQ